MKITICTVITIAALVLAGGQSSYASFTLKDENELGKEFYEKLEAKGILATNPAVNDYITTLGNRILSDDTPSPFNFTFSVIKNSGINAFATPGGYVYVYEGLIKIADNESQIAGVLAHEIAHVKSRHIAQRIEKSQKLGVATLLSVLAGAFLGGGELSAAVTGFSMAAATSLSLKYSRDNEEEADRKGMRYLVSAGYDGKGMLDFLRIMRRYEYYSNSVPSYFLTHPGTGDRIRYLDGLLHTTYTKPGATSITGGLDKIKTLLVLNEGNLSASLKYFQNKLKDNPGNVDFRYGLAVIQGRMGHTAEALENFSLALQQSPENEYILRDLGIYYFNLGRATDAINDLRRAYRVNPNDPDTILYLGRSYEAIGKFSIALELYEKFRNDNPDNEDIYYNLAMMYGKTNNSGDSHYNFGIYFKKKHKPRSALFHFKAAEKDYPPESSKGMLIRKEIDSLGKETQKPEKIKTPVNQL